MSFIPENYPTIVYKYRNWVDDTHKAVLLKNQLWLSSPKDFNDPFDCKIPINYKALTQEEIPVYAQQTVQRLERQILARGLDPKDEYNNRVHRLQNDIETYQKQKEQINTESLDRDFGVLSLSERWNSLLMWSHYADNHRGYCIGFHEEKLRESNIFGVGGQVRYPESKDYPLIHPFEEYEMDSWVTMSHTKSIEWEYEKEYRLTRIIRPGEGRLRTVEDGFIAEVVLGLMMTQEHKQEIIGICKSRNIPVYDLKKVEFRFELERVPL